MSASQFWNDVGNDLEDPDYRREFIKESVRIRSIDAIINALLEAQTESELTKAAIAHAIDVKPETIRRLFSVDSPNPTIATVAQVAATLGLAVTLRPLTQAEKAVITEPLLRDTVDNLGDIARFHALTG